MVEIDPIGNGTLFESEVDGRIRRYGITINPPGIDGELGFSVDCRWDHVGNLVFQVYRGKGVDLDFHPDEHGIMGPIWAGALGTIGSGALAAAGHRLDWLFPNFGSHGCGTPESSGGARSVHHG